MTKLSIHFIKICNCHLRNIQYISIFSTQKKTSNILLKWNSGVWIFYPYVVLFFAKSWSDISFASLLYDFYCFDCLTFLPASLLWRFIRGWAFFGRFLLFLRSLASTKVLEKVIPKSTLSLQPLHWKMNNNHWKYCSNIFLKG